MTPTPEACRSDDHARFGEARDGVCVLAPDWRIRYMNASMLEILRLLGREEKVETLWDALPAWEHTPEADGLREAMASPEPRTFRVDGDRGRGRVWEVSTEPLASGELRVRLRNVTAQAHAERAESASRDAHRSLAEREARLDAVVEGAPVGIVLMDAATFTVREANDFYHRFLEGEWRKPDAIVGHTPWEFLPTFEESGTADIFREVRDTGAPFEIAEFPFAGFERGTTYFRWTLKPLGDPGAPPRYLLLLVAEITEQVRARQEVEAERKALFDVLDALPVGVLVAGAPSGRTVYLNAAGAAMAGRTADELSADEVREYTRRWRLMRPTGEPFPPDELPIARALRGEPTRDVEVVLGLPDGAERTVLVSGVPLRDAAGAVARAMVAFYDITERLALEHALLERSREAEWAAAEAAMRADESRALLAAAEAMTATLDPQEVMERIARIAAELTGADGAGLTVVGGEGRDRTSVAAATGLLEPLRGTGGASRGS
ncbi:MAG TPA: PAS domain-containing protein, partial [Longimicrobium sp.]|nr:PAS domain-containing protein [Longimicrobium sp.]